MNPSPAMNLQNPKLPTLMTSTGEVWLTARGIVECKNRSKRQQTIIDARENIDLVRRVAGGMKRPILIDMTVPAPQTSECRAYYTSSSTGEIALAVAVLTPSTLGRIIANFLIGLNSAPVPMKLFTDRAEAEAWLLTFL